MRELIWALLPDEELFAPAAPADPRGNFEEREPKQFLRVQQSVPYKNNSIKSLWDWIPNIANDGNMVFGPPCEIRMDYNGVWNSIESYRIL